jgi:hypothetical protein
LLNKLLNYTVITDFQPEGRISPKSWFLLKFRQNFSKNNRKTSIYHTKFNSIGPSVSTDSQSITTQLFFISRRTTMSALNMFNLSQHAIKRLLYIVTRCVGDNQNPIKSTKEPNWQAILHLLSTIGHFDYQQVSKRLRNVNPKSTQVQKNKKKQKIK